MKVEQLVKPIYEKMPEDFWYHGLLHVQNVVNNSRKIASQENLDLFPVEIASWCHDLGRVVESNTGNDNLNSLSKCRDHARLSIYPTTNVLSSLDVSEDQFNHILEAVTIHSYWKYGGPNKIAQALRDSDKIDALGAWGILRSSSGHLKKDFVKRETIFENWNNTEAIKGLADETLSLIKKEDPETKNNFLKHYFGKVLEWVENGEFHFDSTYDLFHREMDYTQKAKKFLLD